MTDMLDNCVNRGKVPVFFAHNIQWHFEDIYTDPNYGNMGPMGSIGVGEKMFDLRNRRGQGKEAAPGHPGPDAP
eukprot:8733839-Pyramimonas_sp.AAC.1